MTRAIAADETPVYFEGGDGALLGVVTTVPGATAKTVICAGGWHGGSINANRMVVRLARKLAEHGRTVVRFDWHGAGESPGHVRFFRVDEPGEADALGALALLSEQPDQPVSMVGTCIGSRAVLAVAPEVPQLDAVALVSFPFPAARAKTKRAERIGWWEAVRYAVRPSVLRGWLQPATRRVYLKYVRLKWQALTRRFTGRRAPSQGAEAERRERASAAGLERLVAQIDQLVARGVRVLFLFGSGDAAYEHFVKAVEGPLGPLLESAGEQLEVRVVDGDLSGFSSLESQQALIDNVTDWLARDDRQA